MGPFAALDSVMSKYMTFKGRASRSEYWWFAFMKFVILCVAIAGDIYFLEEGVPPSLNPLSYFCVLWLLLTFLPSWAVAVRRLHDSNRAGIWLFVQLVPTIGSIWYIYLLCVPSDRSENHYGQPPNGPRGTQYKGHDINDLGIPSRQSAKPHNPYAGYALLEQSRREPTPEMLEARREQVSDYYRTRVLKQA